MLRERSGLPGPRANLSLADEFASVAPMELILRLAASDDEYLALCGSIGLGELLVRGEDVAPHLRELAQDDRWRVREGVARGLQRLGDVDPVRLRSLVARWASDSEALVQRAAIAAICEPRLLADIATARAALDACRTVTRAFLAGRERNRVLRQALGYCWSVAIAGAPAEGLEYFGAVRQNDDPDAQWIVRENLQKSRLQRLL